MAKQNAEYEEADQGNTLLAVACLTDKHSATDPPGSMVKYGCRDKATLSFHV